MSEYFCQAHDMPGGVVLVVRGDVDLAASDRLWKDIASRFVPPTEVVIDCSGITFLDSMGLRSLIRAAQAAEGQEGVRFALAAPSAPVLRVLDLSGTADVFVILQEVPGTTEPSVPTGPARQPHSIVLPRSAHIPSADGTALETPAAEAG
jgi:anti-anti-sigma factor